jgi:1A family penicillin-binding protein
MGAWVAYDLPLAAINAKGSEPHLTLYANDESAVHSSAPRRGPPVKLEQVPPHVIAAVLAIEDRRFYSHFGIDPRGIVRAAYRNWYAGQVVEGGSTITQQYVRGRYLESDRSFRRKLREAILAVWLEFRADKKAILEAYLNETYFGSGAYGIGAAAQTYFGKSVSDLSLEESAILAGLVRAPSDLNPLSNRAAAEWRARTVLGAMVAEGQIAQKEAVAAAARLGEVRLAARQRGSWFGDWLQINASALATIVARDGSDAVSMHTTLDPRLQQIAERVVREAIEREGVASQASQAALIAMRPDGAVVAMVGGVNYAESSFNRATQAKRQPGSLFKVFVYYAALRNGFQLDDIVVDAPIEIGTWKPENYDRQFLGRMTLAEAFWRSRNLPAVQLAMQVGLDEVVRAARDLGIDAALPERPSMALGAMEVSLLDITGAFASIRAGMAPVEPWAIAAIEANGAAQRLRPARKVATPGDLRRHRLQLIELLRGVVERGTGREAAPGDETIAAGKTGTSGEFRDAWFVGFNDDLVAGVWVGNDDNSPMDKVTGGRLPAAIWRRFIEEAAPILEAMPSSQPGLAEVAMLGGSEETVAGGACDVEACSARYRSFRASDCTYQPYNGERRVCTQSPAANQLAARDTDELSSIQKVVPARQLRIEEIAPPISVRRGQLYFGNFGVIVQNAPPGRLVEPNLRLRRNTPDFQVWEGGR